MKFKRANVNIALLKYWGKVNQKLNLPQQTSLSVTADTFYTLTNVTLDPTLTRDKVFLDGKELTSLQYTRVIQHLNTLRDYFKRKEYCLVTSLNHVIIRAGFASSASAFAALTAAYIEAIGETVDETEMSRIARLGSGSATRSVHGGFVLWHKGEDHASSHAEKLDLEWPEFRLMFTILDKSSKTISSRIGMQLCVEKSPSYPAYVEQSEALVAPMIAALMAKDINKVGAISEQSAELMRNVMLESDIEYHTPETQKLIQMIHTIRDVHELPVYYTFDAGANLILITLAPYVDEVIKLLPNIHIEVSEVGGGIRDTDS